MAVLHVLPVSCRRIRPPLLVSGVAALILVALPLAAGAQQIMTLGSVSALQGTIASGDVSSLAADDDVTLLLNSAASGGKKGSKKKQYTDWFATTTVPDDTIALRVTLASSAGMRVKQTIYLLRWKKSKWKPIDNAHVTAAGLVRVATVDSAFHFVSPTGEVRIRVRSEGKGAFAHASDLLQVEVLPAGSFPDDDPLKAEPAAPEPVAGPTFAVTGGAVAQGGRVRFATSGAASPDLVLFDARGRHVADLAPVSTDGSVRSYVWDGADARGARVARGVYFARAVLATGASVQRIVWLRD